MKALQRQLQSTNVVDNGKATIKKEPIHNWDEWTRWLQERQDAIDNAKTSKQKAEVAARYQRSYQGRI